MPAGAEKLAPIPDFRKLNKRSAMPSLLVIFQKRWLAGKWRIMPAQTKANKKQGFVFFPCNYMHKRRCYNWTAALVLLVIFCRLQCHLIPTSLWSWPRDFWNKSKEYFVLLVQDDCAGCKKQNQLPRIPSQASWKRNSKSIWWTRWCRE